MFTSVFSQLLAFTPRRSLITYAIGLGSIVVALLLRSLFWPLLTSSANIYLFLYIAVLASSILGGIRSGIVATISGLAYLFYTSYAQTFPDLYENPESKLILFTVVSLLSSLLLTQIKNAYYFSLSVINSLDSFIVVLSPQGKIVDINQAFLTTFGATRYYMVGKTLLDRFAWKYPATSKAQLKKALAHANAGKAARFDLKVVFSTQHVRVLDCACTPLLDQQGNLVRVIFSASDITSRVRAENNVLSLNQSLQKQLDEQQKTQSALMRSEIRFKRLVDSNLIGVIVADLRGHIIEANEAFTSMTGYSQEEIKAGNLGWKHITPPEYDQADLEAQRQLKKSGEAHPFEKEFVRKDGSRLPVLIGIAMLEGSKDRSVAFIVDIAARKKLEKRKDEFIGLASHELKTPLTSIKVFTQLLERTFQNQPDPKPLSYLTKINQQIARLSSLVEDLLDISKIESGKLSLNYEPTDINKLVKTSLTDIQAIAQHHTLKTKGEVKSKVMIDPYRMDQVLTNLLTNAIKYSPVASEILVALKENDSHLTIEVRDRGVGIPLSQQSKVFEKFFRAQGKDRHSFPGLGLGLYLSKQIVDRHGGEIWVKSQEGVGTTFGVVVPKQKVTP